MAHYNMNQLVALTRKAKRISQEELSDGICSTVALSDYENGKYGIRRKKYRKLMQRMGRISNVNYAVCMDKDGGLLEERIQMERAFKRYDYEAAEKYMLRLKERADDNVLTQQYLARAEALVEYYRKRISAEELIRRLDSAIKMTVPEYEVYLGRMKRVFPFVKEELRILMSLGLLIGLIAMYGNGVARRRAFVLQALKFRYESMSTTVPNEVVDTGTTVEEKEYIVKVRVKK